MDEASIMKLISKLFASPPEPLKPFQLILDLLQYPQTFYQSLFKAGKEVASAKLRFNAHLLIFYRINR
jgi:hypothetical protein